MQFKGKEIDLSKALPFKMRDYIALDKTYGIQLTDFQRGDLSIEKIANMYFYILHKADDSITLDDVLDLDPNDPVFVALGKAMGDAKSIDPPT